MESLPETKPFLRFYLSESLCEKTLDVLTNLENAEDGREYRKALADIVCELTDSGMDYYFMRPLRLSKAGFLTEQSANLGMGAATRMIGTVLRKIIGGMNNPQLLVISGCIREFME